MITYVLCFAIFLLNGVSAQTTYVDVGNQMGGYTTGNFRNVQNNQLLCFSTSATSGTYSFANICPSTSTLRITYVAGYTTAATAGHADPFSALSQSGECTRHTFPAYGGAMFITMAISGSNYFVNGGNAFGTKTIIGTSVVPPVGGARGLFPKGGFCYQLATTNIPNPAGSGRYFIKPFLSATVCWGSFPDGRVGFKTCNAADPSVLWILPGQN